MMTHPTTTTTTIPQISLHDFETRKQEITTDLISAARTHGFFTLKNTPITPQDITAAFETSARFFSLPVSVKSSVPYTTSNVGWEQNSQVRPSTGLPDMKESYQIRYGEAEMCGKWVDDETLPGFREEVGRFMEMVRGVSEKLMRCFALALGFDEGFFVEAHDVNRAEENMCVLRLLRYPAVPRSGVGSEVQGARFRAGAHTDWGVLTLLFQQEGDSGLEVCAAGGEGAKTEFGVGDDWVKVGFAKGDIVCNIGDALMRWSDDGFRSTLHRVRAPSDPEKDWFGDRYSIAYFNQPCKDAIIQGPGKKYPPVTGEQFIKNAIQRNYAAMQAKKAGLVDVGENTSKAVEVGS